MVRVGLVALEIKYFISLNGLINFPITNEEIADHIEQLAINFTSDDAKKYNDFADSYP